jgi:hypothetical protein
MALRYLVLAAVTWVCSCGFGSYPDRQRAGAGEADGEDSPGQTRMARQQDEGRPSAACAAPTVRRLSRAINYLQGLVSDLSTGKLNLAYPCKTGKTCGRQAVVQRWEMSFGQNWIWAYSRSEPRFEYPDIVAKPIQKSEDLIRLQ